ncbi:MAG: NAD(P)H-quinone oxidoreductase [Clostridia bacterium]|nr:NAD(P)H-quinone oxidoreductase [Clostridia bacterium]MBQ7339111.1 NAD(P)H-quinone oxidoreductase [Clostridia bacterium]
MKAIMVNQDQSLRWGDVPDPVLNTDDVLIEIHAAALNRADLMQREGNYPPPPGAPAWMGLEVAGVIIDMGEDAAQKSRFTIGDRVCALLGGGGYAEYVAVRYDMLMPIPDGFSMVEAAAMPEAFATAYLNLFYEGGIRSGDTLLVTAGASGLASVIIPMAKAFGIRVITTVRSDSKAKRIAPLGADRIVNTKTTSLAEVLREELEGGHGVDVAIDCVGGAEMGACLPYLNRGARWIMIAALGGEMTEIDLKNIYVRNIRIIGSTLRSRAPEVKAGILADVVDKVYPLIERHSLRPTVFAVLPIEQAEAAQDMLYRSENVGKVVMTVR